MQDNKQVAKMNADFKAADEIYKVARERADVEMAELKSGIEDVKVDSFALGFLGANKAQRAYCEFTDALMLYRIKKTKDYKKTGNTWEQFCEAAGYPRRTAEDIIAGIAPVVEAFSANLAAFSGLGLSEIRYLGKTITAESAAFSEDGANLVIGDETIPATPADILAYIKTQKEHINESTAALAAKDKVLQDKEKLINKYAKDLSRLEGKLKKQEITPAEAGFIKEMDNLRTGFDGYLLMLDPDRVANLEGLEGSDLTPRMRAAYLSAFDYMKKQVLMAAARGELIFGSAVMCPEAAWHPGMDRPLMAVEASSGVDEAAGQTQQ